MENYQEVLIENNHIHHAGYGIVDDMAGIFFGRHPRGVIIKHNKIHDIYTNNYCGNGIYPDTGSSGSKVFDNLVYSLSHTAFNLNYGQNHDVYNNIFAFCKNGISFGCYKTTNYTLNIHNNIIYLNRDDSYPAFGPLLNDDVINHFDFNIYFKTENRNISINNLSFQQWQEKGFDNNTLIVDPFFKDPENGDFSFKSKENVKKINFNEFNLSFGVIGDEWIKIAESYNYHDPIKRTNELPLIGFESFENGNESYYYKRANINSNQPGISYGITNEKSFSGNHSFKIQHIEKDTSFGFNFGTYFRNGTVQFTMMLFFNNESDYKIDFGFGGWICLSKGNINFGWSTGKFLGNYTLNKWFKFGFRINMTNDMNKNENKKYILIINDDETIHDILDEKFDVIDYVRIKSNGKGTSYIDDVNSSSTDYVEPYFWQELNNNDFEPTAKAKKGLKIGQIIGIIVGIISVIIIAIVVIVLVMLKRKKSDNSSDFNLLI